MGGESEALRMEGLEGKRRGEGVKALLIGECY